MSPPLRHVLSLSFVMNVCCSFSGVAAGEEAPDPRYLGGHQFQLVQRIPDPFVTTHIRTGTGAGVATGFEAPFYDTNGDTLGTLEGDIAFFSLEIEYQKNLFEWGALRLAVSGSGRAGIDEQSVLADGINTVYGAVLQGKAAVLRREKFQVAMLGTVSRKNVFGLDPFGFAQRVVENGGLTKDNSLVNEGDIHRFSFGASAAHAWKRWLGVSGFAEVGSAQPVLDKADNETLFRGGAVVDLDLLPLKGLPLGVALGYDYDSFPEGGPDVAKGIHSGTLAVNYTGRRDFHLGLETIVSTLKQTDVESSFAATSLNLSLRYFF